MAAGYRKDGSTLGQYSDPFNRVANRREVIMDLARNGFMHLMPAAKLFYYFSWHDASEGKEVAAFLARLPSRYVVPGSSATGAFNFDVFARSAFQVEQRQHPVIAFGRREVSDSASAPGGGSPSFFEAFARQSVTTRHLVVFSYMRDVLSHRLAYWEQHVLGTRLEIEADYGEELELAGGRGSTQATSMVADRLIREGHAANRRGELDTAQPGDSRRTTLGCCITLVRMLPGFF